MPWSLAGLRDEEPSEARGADSERAGRRPRAHQAARSYRELRGASFASRARGVTRLPKGGGSIGTIVALGVPCVSRFFLGVDSPAAPLDLLWAASLT